MLSLVVVVAKRHEVKNRAFCEFTDFVGRSRPCRPKSEGNLLPISYIINIAVKYFI